MLKRSIMKDLENWKNRAHHPLVISGLRQIGKTFIVKEFGKRYYENVVYLDLRANKLVHKAFEGNFDVNLMVMAITANVLKATFVPEKTLLILDEIQDCPNARSSLKYWDLDGRYDVIATGSFLGVKGFRAPYSRGIPVGYEETMDMFPLTFHEFLLNIGIKDDVYEYISEQLHNNQMVAQPIHDSLRSLYLQYLIVGGMPEAVNSFIDNHDLNMVRKIQNRILKSIKDDFGRYKDDHGNDFINETLKLRAEACLNSMPAQLSKEYKKFQYSLVDSPGKSTDKALGLQYLEDLGLVIKAYNIREISSPLEGVKMPTEFKVYFADTGLLLSQLNYGVASNILDGDISAYKGAIAENMVAQALHSQNIMLYYYRDSSGSPELDFIMEYLGENIIVECKSTNNRATSMKYVLSNPKKYGKHKAIKISDTNVGHGEGFLTVPLYALGFIEEQKVTDKIPVIDIQNLKVPNKE